MKKQFKMIAFDLDGTLLTTDKRFTEYSKEVIAKAIEQGITVLPATGRPYTGIPADIREFPGIRYAVTANGGRIIDLENDEVVYEKQVPYETAAKVLDIYEHYDTVREIFYSGVGYTEVKMIQRLHEFLPEPAMADYVASTRKGVENIRTKFEMEKAAVDKVQATFLHVEDKKKAIEELKSVPGIEITGALVNNIEVSAEGVNKGKALIRLGELLGIRKEEIMAFGDGANDLEMMREAGFGVCMENGTEEVKEAADYITGTNDEEGVAKAIEQYALSSTP